MAETFRALLGVPTYRAASGNLFSGRTMRTSLTLRARRHSPHRSFVSRHSGKVALTLLGLAGVAPWLDFPHGADSVPEVAGFTLTALCGLSVVVGCIRSLVPERMSQADLEAAEWFRALVADKSWLDEPWPQAEPLHTE
jgi:hypothetical protein